MRRGEGLEEPRITLSLSWASPSQKQLCRDNLARKSHNVIRGTQVVMKGDTHVVTPI